MPVMLDKYGLMLALAMGLLIAVFGGLSYLALILIFLFSAVVATKYENRRKREMGIYEHERSWENVLSNGLLPTILAVGSPFLGSIPYIATLAAVSADKFASELGVLSGNPIYLGSFASVRAGKSGAVSVVGFVASLLGAALIATISIFIFGINPTQALIITLIGFAGSVIDSVVGIFEEMGIGTKGTTNFICSLSGAVLGYYLL